MRQDRKNQCKTMRQDAFWVISMFIYMAEHFFKLWPGTRLVPEMMGELLQEHNIDKTLQTSMKN